MDRTTIDYIYREEQDLKQIFLSIMADTKIPDISQAFMGEGVELKPLPRKKCFLKREDIRLFRINTVSTAVIVLRGYDFVAEVSLRDLSLLDIYSSIQVAIFDKNMKMIQVESLRIDPVVWEKEHYTLEKFIKGLDLWKTRTEDIE